MSTTSTEFRNAAIVERLNSDKEEKEGKKKEKRNIPVLFVPRTAIGKKKECRVLHRALHFPLRQNNESYGRRSVRTF